MEETNNNQIQIIKDAKFSVEVCETSKGFKYVGSIKVRCDTLEELRINLEQAKQIVEQLWK